MIKFFAAKVARHSWPGKKRAVTYERRGTEIFQFFSCHQPDWIVFILLYCFSARKKNE